MTSVTVFDHLRRISERFRPARILHTVLSPEALQRALQRERVRSDRTGTPFCIVLFSLDKNHNRNSVARLAYVVANRVRVTDDVGWYGDCGVATVLPATDFAGARCFASDILRLAANKRIYPTATVYSHEADAPTDWDDSDEAQPPHKAAVLPGTERRNGPLIVKRAAAEILAHPVSRGKRMIDVLGSAVALLLVSPMLAVVAVAVKATSPGPILFRQCRAGLGGRPFVMYKFRSMCEDADALKEKLRHLSEQDGPAFKVRNDPRLTLIGQFLRTTSLDELPQLFNVIKGDMSLVGPRPPTFDEVRKYAPWYRRRLQVTPGITCIWQVYGRSRVSFEEWMRMDLQYINRSSPWLDVKLMLKTIPAVLFRKGAF